MTPENNKEAVRALKLLPHCGIRGLCPNDGECVKTKPAYHRQL